MLASITSGKVSGANVPTWSTLRDGISAYTFSPTQMKEVWVSFHINHDYAPGTPLYPHVHFVPTTNEAAGVVRWGIEYAYSRGHSRGTFPTTQTVYIEHTVEANQQYCHYISEVADDAVIFDQSTEVDGVLLCRVFRDATHANDTYTGEVAGIFVDMHYLSDRDSTVNKKPNFYDPEEAVPVQRKLGLDFD